MTELCVPTLLDKDGDETDVDAMLNNLSATYRTDQAYAQFILDGAY